MVLGRRCGVWVDFLMIWGENATLAFLHSFALSVTLMDYNLLTF